MDKVKIKLVTIGHLPRHLDLNRISGWQSLVFELAGEIENFELRCDSDSEGWEFSDVLLQARLPDHAGADFLIAIVNVPIQDNWYSRRLGNNQVVFTFSQIKDFLVWENIPIENAILRVLYAYTLLYRRSGNTIPCFGEASGFTHDETRGCLFDMNGIKSDLIESCNKPIVCAECEERLKNELVSTQTIRTVQKEIRQIRKHLYYRAFDFVKTKPVATLLISSVFAVLLGVSGSLIASYVYDGIKSQPVGITRQSSGTANAVADAFSDFRTEVQRRVPVDWACGEVRTIEGRTLFEVNSSQNRFTVVVSKHAQISEREWSLRAERMKKAIDSFADHKKPKDIETLLMELPDGRFGNTAVSVSLSEPDIHYPEIATDDKKARVVVKTILAILKPYVKSEQVAAPSEP